jgi:hypothetical protein
MTSLISTAETWTPGQGTYIAIDEDQLRSQDGLRLTPGGNTESTEIVNTEDGLQAKMRSDVSGSRMESVAFSRQGTSIVPDVSESRLESVVFSRQGTFYSSRGTYGSPDTFSMSSSYEKDDMPVDV